MARGPHLACEAVLCGPQGLFALLISSWKGLLSIFWEAKRFKPKPSSGWFSRNQFGFAAKTFFLVFTYFLGKIPVILTEISTVNVARTSKKVGQPCIKRKPNFSIINYSFNFCCSLKAKSILEVSKIYEGSLAYYLALNVDITEVFVLAKPSWQIL